MKDRVFSGRDVAAAVVSAAHALGLRPEQLRYVVLEHGQAAGLGLSPTMARIAVLADSRERHAATVVAEPPHEREDGTQALIEALSRALGQELQADDQSNRGRRHVWLRGPGCEALFDAEGHTLRALEHLLGRVAAGETGLRLECAGYREFRDRWLCEHAKGLAEAVLEDGVARATSALNAYERRLIHMTIAEHPGLRTHSHGEGNDRRVTVALAEDAAAERG